VQQRNRLDKRQWLAPQDPRQVVAASCLETFRFGEGWNSPLQHTACWPTGGSETRRSACECLRRL